MATGREYTAEFEAQTVAAASGDVDLFEFTCADDKPIELYGLHIVTTSELAEAQEEWLRLRVIRGHTTSGSTPGSTPTPVPLNPNAAAAGFTVECLNATIASAGTAVNCHSDAFNVRAGYSFWWPEPGPMATQASLLVVRLMAAVTDDVTMTATAYLREF